MTFAVARQTFLCAALHYSRRSDPRFFALHRPAKDSKMSRAKFSEENRGTDPGMRLVVLPGDGIGPEICAATCEILQLLNDKMSLGISLEAHEIGLAALKRCGTTFPAAAMEACRAADGIVL